MKNSSRFKKGHIPWNKGLKGTQKWSEKRKKEFSQYAKEHGFGKWLKGKKPYNCGKKRKSEVVRKIVEIRKRNGSFKHTEEWKKNHSKRMQGKDNPSWKGGIAISPYLEEFNKKLRQKIRKRDCYICQECGIYQDELKSRVKKLSVHHIDYNKKNNNLNNLISLCISCHSKTNFDRDDWQQHFNKLIKKTYVTKQES